MNEQQTLPFPAPPGNYSPGYMASLISVIQRAIRGVRYQNIDALYLMAPDGGLWKVTVSNAGTLTTTAASKTDARPPL